MASVCDTLVVVQFATAGPKLLVLNSTVTDAMHSGGTVVLQVTLAAGVEPSTTLSALTVIVESANWAAANVVVIVTYKINTNIIE